MMMEKPMVSVVMATYRRKDALDRALRSVLQQTYEPLEIVVVDDNGQEEWNQTVRDIVDAALLAYPEKKVQLLVNHPNLGSAQTRNKGIAAAQGEYITFLDDDDVYLMEKVAAQVEKMVQDGADFGITDLWLYDEATDKVTDKRARTYIKQYDHDELLKYHLLNHMTGTDTMMFRKEYLQSIGGFDHIDMGDEFYLMLKAIEGKGKFSYLPRCHVKAYVHAQGGGLSTGSQKIEGEKALYEHKKKYFSCLTHAERQHVRMRHHAVLGMAYLKKKDYVHFVLEAACSALSSPLAFLKLLITRG